jgi:hypothetical protein
MMPAGRAMRIRNILLACAVCAAGCATPRHAPVDDAALDAFTARRLETFADEREFLAYVEQAQAAAKARGVWWSRRDVKLAQAAECPQEPCPASDADERIVVTGSRITGGSRSITNTQKAGVDEGDIVKNVGRFLVVLQDGRLFSIDTGEGALRLADRANVYRDPKSDAWYDEVVVSGRRLAVLGYSYDEKASEIAVFDVGEDGSLTHRATFYLSSDDYYDADNYATRLVGDDLVVYTPFYLSAIKPGTPPQWPLARRWIGRADGGSVSQGVPLFDATAIYKPVQRTLDPVIHAVSVCPISAAMSDAELACRTTALIGPDNREFYVSQTDVYLWISASYYDVWPEAEPASCPAGLRPLFRDAPPAALFRLPLARVAPGFVRARGLPLDQFALDSNETQFRALLAWSPTRCDDYKNPISLKLLRLPLTVFSEAPAAVAAMRYTDVPSPGRTYENRFTDDYVVYGGRDSWGTDAPEEAEPAKEARVVAVPLAAPRSAATLTAPHGVIRAERVGDDVVLTGYRDAAGLGVSLVKLGARPRIASTEFLEGRYESEGRSHAFNSAIDEAGAGLIGLPTVRIVDESGRWWWRSDASDVSFLALERDGALIDAGSLAGREGSEHKDYVCEVSCIDWYGNTRPVFLDGRIFALSGADLIEGEMRNGAIVEIGRLNLTAPSSGRSK